MNRHLPTETIKYAVVAGLCAALHNAIVIVFDWASIHYAVSLAIAFPICIALGYTLQAKWTYAQPLSARALVRYLVPTLANYPASLVLLFVLSDLLRVPMVIASPLVTIVLMIWNFALTRWALRSVRPSAVPA